MEIHRSLMMVLPCTLLLLAGCTYNSKQKIPLVYTPTLENLSKTIDVTIQNAPDSSWWLQYQSPDLNQLITQLSNNNLDLATAQYRIHQAKALLGIHSADDWPTLNAQLNQRNNYYIDGNPKTDANSNSSASNLNFSAAYEVDIWGGRSAARYSAEIGIIARQQEYQSLLLQLQATFAQTYFNYLALQQRYTIAQQNLNASEALLNLIQLRFNAGSASGIEVSQQRNTWLTAQAVTLNIELTLEITERLLAVLLGRESLNIPPLRISFTNIQAPDIQLVQPAALLEYRPDIRLAESQLQIEGAKLYQQQKSRWPQLNLTGGLSISDVFQTGGDWTGTFLSSLAAPLFNTGKIKRQIIVNEMDVAVAEIHYRQVVIQAIQETLDTLSSLKYQQRLLQIREQELSNNKQLYELAKLRYESGDTDFINLLTAQRSWFSARDSSVQAKNDYLLATINVFKAMGVSPTIADKKTLN